MAQQGGERPDAGRHGLLCACAALHCPPSGAPLLDSFTTLKQLKITNDNLSGGSTTEV